MSQPGNRVVYHPLVARHDIPRLDRNAAKRIRKAIEEKLVSHPEIYGLPLRGTLKQYWKLRVDDYRVVYGIKSKIVFIFVIANRKEVYKLADRRTAYNF